MKFVDFKEREIFLTEEIKEKINNLHPEVSLEQIAKTLLDPIEVRKSRHKNWSELYYGLTLKRNRFVCAVVKFNTLDGNNYVETAYISSRIKAGEIVYLKKERP